jgi:glyoxylase-like metal-dependent hydrolase (beta-lactamase superfamily II)
MAGSELHYPLGDAVPQPGHTLDIAPGVKWVRMGLPFALNHINLWLLRDELDGRAGWTLVDCGITNDATREAWERLIAEEMDGLPLLRVVVTHMHPDHVGLAHWLTARFSTPDQPCRLWMSATDYHGARLASQSTTGFGGDAAAAFFASHGLTDPDSVQKVRQRSNYYASMVPQVPVQYRRMMGGQAIAIGGREWQCIAGYGHSPEHISLYAPALELLISGDMVLPRISTNVSVYDLEPEGNPLPLYLASVGALAALPESTLVLPSHGQPFLGLQVRAQQLVRHHDERLGEVIAACTESPRSAADLLPVLFKRPLDLHQTTFAMGEAIAHLNALWHQGVLRRQRDADGVFRYSAPPNKESHIPQNS